MQFPAALQSWFNTFKTVSVRQIAQDSKLSNLSQFRSGNRRITFDALTRLLPVIEQRSSRLHAITLHLAYLADEVVDAYKPNIRITATDNSGDEQQDIYERRGSEWAERSRNSHEFWAMWDMLDGYMHAPGRLSAEQEEATDTVITAIQENNARETLDVGPVGITIHHTTAAGVPVQILEGIPDRHSTSLNEAADEQIINIPPRKRKVRNQDT